MGDMLYEPGQTHSVTRAVRGADIERFAEVSGDTNPMHLDERFAATTRFGRRIAHGMLGASFISALIGTRFPGPGTIYLSQSLRFTAPVFLDDVLTVTATVKAYRADKGILTLETAVTNQRDQTVISGEAVCLVAASEGEPAPEPSPELTARL